MTDQTRREPNNPPPDRDNGGRLPARRPPSEAAPAERFTSPPAARKFELTPERAAGIVRQSSNARWAGFLSVVVVVLFVILYYFYELGAPLGLSQPRLEAEEEHQQVVAIERGYNLYQANCARCHGVDGEGGVGPALNDQVKLYQHLNEDYLRNVLEVGGRYVCGTPDSQMPVWSDENGGPLNYRQIEEIIAFIRAPMREEQYDIRHPELNEPTGRKFQGWRDPNYRPEPGATPYPDCWIDALGGGEASPSAPAASPPGEASAEPSASPAASGTPAATPSPAQSVGPSPSP